MIGSAQDVLRKYQFQMQMLRVTEDNKSKYEQRYTQLERDMQEARTKYFQMEEETKKFMTVKSSTGSRGFALGDPNKDDHFIRH
mmetsp:Transcript_22094/g.27172  ORF Transcript_22094/g.27172 Transcript_22094/m.27172 type:complete len:84 (-) Transcript_22094:421-672(-)